MACTSPHISCVAKGKEHKNYEFGTKASLVLTKTSGVLNTPKPCVYRRARDGARTRDLRFTKPLLYH